MDIRGVHILSNYQPRAHEAHGDEKSFHDAESVLQKTRVILWPWHSDTRIHESLHGFAKITVRKRSTRYSVKHRGDRVVCNQHLRGRDLFIPIEAYMRAASRVEWNDERDLFIPIVPGMHACDVSSAQGMKR
jgi:hypothetical protein